MKIAINKCYGGFTLSDKAVERLKELGYDKKAIKDDMLPKEYRDNNAFRGRKYWGHLSRDHSLRTNPLLIKVIEELGPEASQYPYANITIVEVPDDTEYEIEEYDGIEWVAEKHRTWG